MTFLSPITALIAAAIALPSLMLLYFLKLKRKPAVVPSTLLWQRAVQDLQVNSPFQRIRNSLLLWVQLLLLALLLLAMARPSREALADPGARVVIVLDRSASMSARLPSGETRLEAAKDQALALVDRLKDREGGAPGGVMVVSFAERATTVQGFTGDLARVRSAIRGVTPTDQASRFASVAGLVEPHTRQASDVVVHVFTDGRFAASPSPPNFGSAGVRFVSPDPAGDGGAMSENLGVVAFAARRDPDEPGKLKVLARLQNSGAQPVRCSLSLTVDGQSVPGGVKRVEVPAASPISASGEPGALGSPGEVSVNYTLVLPGSGDLELTHDHRDVLSSDNTVRARVAPSRELAVLLVTPGNRYLEAAIRASGVQRLEIVRPTRFKDLDTGLIGRGGWDADEGAGGFDVVVMDRVDPAELGLGEAEAAWPTAPSVWFGAVPIEEPLARRTSSDQAPPAEYLLNWRRGHPLLRSVELTDVVFRRPGRLALPRDATALATAREGPVLATLRRRGHPHVLASFDVLETDWPLSVSFPAFFQNTLPWLALGRSASGASVQYTTGQNPSIARPGAGGVLEYSGPVRLSGQALSGQVSLPDLARVGWYTTDDPAVDAPDDRLAVNLLQATESDTRPASRLALAGTTVEATAGQTLTREELWPWLVWGALGVLLVEWFLYGWRSRV